MKSIFSVTVFILMAILLSQPEKAEMKYLPLSVSVPHSFMQNDLSKDFSINFIPNTKSQFYKISLNNQISKIINSSDISFPFSSCEIQQRPNISIKCELGDASKAQGLASLSVRPLMTIGQGDVDFYIIEMSKVNLEGNRVNYQFFTKPNLITANKTETNYTITQK